MMRSPGGVLAPYVILLMLIGTGCGDGDRPANPPIEETPEPSVVNADDPLDWIRKRYDRTRQMEASGQLRCDTVRYRCDAQARYGSFVFCYAGEELMRAGHEMLEGDHFSVTERYFFDGEELYFAHLTQGSWQFGGPMEQDDAGNEVPGTIDKLHEERRYYDRGNLIDRLYKDYVIRSGEDSPTPEQVPNQPTGVGVDAQLGSDVLLGVALSGNYDCR